MKTDHLEGHVVGPRNDESTVMAPAHASDLLGVEVGVLFVKNQRGEGLDVRGSLEDFAFDSRRDKEEPRVRREGHGRHRVPKVEVSHHNFATHVDDQGEAIFVD